MIIRGVAIKFGDNINTDLIIPGKFLNIDDPTELATHAMEGIDQDFYNNAKNKGIVVAGNNFGCGSSREQAAICLKYAGIKAIIAKSFARIFYRNAINQGLVIIENIDISDLIKNDDNIEIDLNKNIILNKSKNKNIEFKPIPKLFFNIMKSEGLINFLKEE